MRSRSSAGLVRLIILNTSFHTFQNNVSLKKNQTIEENDGLV